MNEKETWTTKLLRWLGIIEPVEVDKNEMCRKAQSACSKSCETCIWRR